MGVCRLGNGVMKMSPSLLFSFSEVAPCTEGTAGLSVAEGSISSKSGVVPPPRWRPRWRRIQYGVREGPGV